jgi:hypothetical protein
MEGGGFGNLIKTTEQYAGFFRTGLGPTDDCRFWKKEWTTNDQKPRVEEIYRHTYAYLLKEEILSIFTAHILGL